MSLDRIWNNSVLAIIDRFLSLSLALIFTILIAKFIGAESLGDYHLGMSVAAIIGVVANLGIQVIVNREIAKNKNKLSLYLGNAIAIRIFFSLPVAVILSLLISLLLKFQQETVVIIVLASIYSQLLSNILLVNGALTSLHRVDAVLLVNLSYKLINIFLLVLLLVNGANLEIIMIMLCLSMSVLIVLVFRYMQRLFPDLKIRFSRRFSKLLIFTSMPLIAAAVAEVLSLKIDMVMLGVLESKENVGLYGAVYSIYLAIVMIPLAVTKVFFPNFVQMMEIDVNNAKGLIIKISLMFVAYSFFVAVLLIPMADFVMVSIYTEEFLAAADVLVILAAGSVMVILNRLFNYVLVAIKENVVYMYITMFGTLVNVVGNIILIPIYSIVGAAISTVVTELMILVLSFYIVRSRFKQYVYSK